MGSFGDNKYLLLTGATGFLGSFLLNALVEKGYRIAVLCRPTGNESAEKRIAGILEWFGSPEVPEANLIVFEGYLEKENFGMKREDYLKMKNLVSDIIHCASETSFSEKMRTELENVNITGLKNILQFAKSSNTQMFHYISTAYTAGVASGTCREELHFTKDFYNAYEETKNTAEHICSDFCLSNGIGLNIYRPSIVYGHSETGKTRKFNAFYYPVKALSYIKDIMTRDIVEREGKRAAAMGVVRKTDGKVFMPIRFFTKSSGKIDMIPIDFFTGAFCAVMETGKTSRIYHIAGDNPCGLRELLEFTGRYFGIEGLEAVYDQNTSEKRTPLEELFNSYIKMYLPYISDERNFEVSNSKEILSRSGLTCPEFDYQAFKKAVDYAVRNEWRNR
ncbi:MAG: SDR family oxidoreductase [Candidatus Delongbacteria bacterium]